MLLKEAIEYADKVCAQLYPHCEVVYISGGIVQQVRELTSICIVCIPKRKETGGTTQGLFDDLPTLVSKKVEAVKSFCNVVNQWPALKGKPTGKFTQRQLPGTYLKLNLYMADADNIGLSLAVHNSPDDFAKKLLARCKQQGYELSNGHLYKFGQLVPVTTEQQLFSLIGWQYAEPCKRH